MKNRINLAVAAAVLLGAACGCSHHSMKSHANHMQANAVAQQRAAMAAQRKRLHAAAQNGVNKISDHRRVGAPAVNGGASSL